MKNIILLAVIFLVSICAVSAQSDKNTKINSDKIENAAEQTQTSAGKVNGSNSTQATNAVTYDFTSSATAYFGGTAACTFVGINTETGDSVFAMIAGDANSDGTINAVDYNDFWLLQNGTVYDYSKNSDFNLDGTINAVDYNDYWLLNNGKATQAPN